MADITDEKIASNACLLLGAENINSFTDASVEAQAAAAMYETTTRALLVERRWSFAVKQAQFSQLTDLPVNEESWEKIYQLPPDFLKLWKLYPEYIGYELFGTKYIYSDFDGEMYGDYTYRTPTENFTDYFVELLEVRLAIKFCMPITEDEKKLATMKELEKDIMIRAKRADANQRKNVGIKKFPLVQVRG